MKRTISLIVLMLCAGAFGADDWAVSVGTTNSIVGVPTANKLIITTVTNVWATNLTVSAGEYVQVGGDIYWTPNGGTTGTNSTIVTNGYNPMTASSVVVTNYTDAPSHKSGTVASSDGVVWKRVESSGRNSLYITAETSDTIYYSVDGNDASADSGGVILSGNPVLYLEDCGYEINFYMPSGTSTVHIVEQ